MAQNSGLHSQYSGLSHPLPPTPGSFKSTPTASQFTQAAYDHNASRIPGLAFGAPQSAASGASTSRDQKVASGAEDGELSDDFDGEFEDLYEPKEPTSRTTQAAIPQVARNPALAISQERVDSATDADADGSSIYDSNSPAPQPQKSTSNPATQHAADDDYSPEDDWEPEPAQSERQKSGSYSPFLSPREVEQEEIATKRTIQGKQETAKISQGQLHGIQQPSTGGPSDPTNSPPVSKENATVPASATISVSQAKKKAQAAILGLWSHKVRFQNYLDEGFDEPFVRSLFTELGLDMSLSKPASQHDGKGTAAASGRDATHLQPPSATQRPSSTSPTERPSPTESTSESANKKGAASAAKTAAEERKERIARKLAAKAQKPVTPVISAHQPMTVGAAYAARNSPAGASAAFEASAKAKTRAENNARIQQKLAALRQKEIEKAKAASDPSSQAQSQESEVNLAQLSKATLSAPDSIRATPGTTYDTRDSQATPAQTSALGSGRNSKSPGLPFSNEALSQTKTRALKRPVASDFDEPRQQNDTWKRNKTHDTLIIDVSDDEDVEMEIGSPTEEADASIQYFPDTTPYASFATQPPLSDHALRRALLSPGGTPAGGATPPKGAKLDLLHGRIEEMKRKIAEAEAKKTKSNTSTPIPEALASAASTRTSSPMVDSTRLPKPSEAQGPRLAVKARDRMASYQKELEELDMREREFLKKIRQERINMQAELARLAREEEESHSAEWEDTSGSTKAYETTASAGDSTHSNTKEDQTDTRTPADLATFGLGVDNVLGIHNMNPAPNTVAGETNRDTSHLAKDDDEDEDVEMDQSSSSSSDSEEDDGPNQPATSQANQADSTDSSDDTSSESDQDDSSVDLPNEGAKPDGSRTTNSTVPAGPADNSHGVDTKPADSSQTGGAAVHEPPMPDAFQAIDEASHQATMGTAQSNQDTSPMTTDPLAYQSPLECFRAYRLHPKFLASIPGGLKSLTYSFKIDANKQICPEALAGEPCPKGDACEYQHFEKMVTSEGEIITQLGASDMFEGEAQTRFIDGLRKVLGELKANNIKDFDGITKAIVQYRASFTEDKTRILNLNGVVI